MARTPVSLAAIVGLVALLGGVLPASAQTIGNAVSFAIVGGAGVAVNGSGSLISGDVGINPAAATLITGIPGNGIVLPPFANHGNDGAAIAASVDVTTLYNSAALAPAGGIVTGPDLSLSGPTANGIYTPGKYFVSVGTAIVPAGGIMRLVGNGLYIFTVNSDLTTAVTGQIIFAGVDPCNVWWRVPTQAAINNANFPGNVVSNAGISLGTATRLFGRALTTAPGIITLAGNNNVGNCSGAAVLPSPVPTLPSSFFILLTLGLLGAGFFQLQRRGSSGMIAG